MKLAVPVVPATIASIPTLLPILGLVIVMTKPVTAETVDAALYLIIREVLEPAVGEDSNGTGTLPLVEIASTAIVTSLPSLYVS